MKNIPLFLLLTFSLLISCSKDLESTTDEFSFILAADWRDKATEKYNSNEYFLGALNAIEKVGKGSFMISPGDLEPASSSANLIAKILGKDYPWYPIVGNHELEDPQTMVFLRELNKNGNSLPNIVKIGPAGCEETTYSFDYGDFHFVVLNEYFDGKSDTGTDGNVVDVLLSWLEDDLSETTKKHIIVAGHEPIISIPDLNNGRQRHVGDALDQYPKQSFKFHQLMMKYDVLAYLHGHTHSTSYTKINGLWQIDCGHARGVEILYPGLAYETIKSAVIENKDNTKSIEDIISTIYTPDTYRHKKLLYYMNLTNMISYKKINNSQGFEILKKFYKKADSLIDKEREEYFSTFWDNINPTRSTFMKFRVSKEKVLIDIYRNDAKGGDYSLTKTVSLNLLKNVPVPSF
ncbi:MAG: hypothetical protein HOB40_01700 [Candidatus Marinimicrobia bacterium]|jgi:3',5'-cyclic AMP phosphodiesterase CpdA|nr:hypothetical protein [Candidatus Neomarinimicrobiota bacterium]MBT3501015.1 hypothetical protein [Candidatus Neomarinimicrobiota bacterium]MBT3838841.1 hypothetical protein [Candidatus Neomarinimicrobiota bacterium]MBT3998818.1 hypothetical protein [Candidatus Neomarinimicrobiota bacterium]MBT4282622.1 hypothetical protein [Candidatus Neomarinimicrobiota bacterium]